MIKVHVVSRASCATCMAERKIRKTFLVKAATADERLRPMVVEWRKRLSERDCMVCASIKRSLAEPTSGN